MGTQSVESHAPQPGGRLKHILWRRHFTSRELVLTMYLLIREGYGTSFIHDCAGRDNAVRSERLLVAKLQLD